MLAMNKRGQRCLNNLKTPADISHIASRLTYCKRTQLRFAICNVNLGRIHLGRQCKNSPGAVTKVKSSLFYSNNLPKIKLKTDFVPTSFIIRDAYLGNDNLHICRVDFKPVKNQ